MKYDLILVNPLIRFGNPYDNIVEYLGFGYIASYLRDKRYTVKIIDFYVEGYSLEEGVNELLNHKCDLLGFTAMSSIYIKNIRQILALMKKRISKHICVGGFYVHHLDNSIIWKSLQVDTYVIGEGEETIAELVSAVKTNKSINDIRGLAYFSGNKIIFNEKRPLMSEEKLSNLPLPARDTAQKILAQNGLLQISSSRGCYGCCTFCAVYEYCSKFTKERWRPLSMDRVVREIEKLVCTYKTKYFDFSDEDFIGPHNRKQRIEYFCNELIKRKLDIKFMIFCRSSDVDKKLFEKLKCAGLDRVFIGIEFGSDELLKKYHKGTSSKMNCAALSILKELHIKSSVGYIMFTPDITIPLLRENLQFYFENCQFKLRALSSKLVIYPETEVYYRFKNLGILGNLTWDITFGDYYECDFLDQNVDLIYKTLSKIVLLLSKSHSYVKIAHLKRENRLLWETNMEMWKNDIYNLILGFLDTVENSDAKLDNNAISQDFINEVIEWDKTRFIIKNT